jgi:hypothetical protein
VQSPNNKHHYDLSRQKIAEAVTQLSPGTYALGRVQENGFCPLYVGRSDHDVARELREWVGEKARYKVFVFSYAGTAQAAFEKECEHFHDFGGTERLDNAQHPQRPPHSDWLCPRCDFYL